MNKNEIIDVFTKELRKNIHHAGWRREETDNVVRHVAEHNDKGFILYSKLDETSVHKEIEKELHYFNKMNQEFEWKVYDYDTPRNLVEILKSYQFEIEEPEALMILPISDNKKLLTAPIPDYVVQITEQKGIEDLINLEDKIWNTSHAELGERLLRDLKNHPEDLLIFGCYDNGILVSGAWMYFEKNTSFASLWGGSTFEEYRGRGYYTSLIAVRAQAAIQKGYKYLTVDASPMSKVILERHGFSCVAYSTPCQSPSNKL
ncbi:N-acetyltransferase [Bacillus sp. 31A1R]|uniref:N-acetyltransferase n=1 Tax=Robertmurraya mangrovi TaxID=3098077 RepID=A0ABU5J366_9BACI|nr:GNAT family N-acetyltransferase [Bacillus sp. 31A1R]MDZ5473843.1 N-acetyltransferase [Bacillus sp. 31A1R]